MSSSPPDPTFPENDAAPRALGADDVQGPAPAPAPAPEALVAEAQRRLRAALEGLVVALSRHNERALEQADQAAEYSALQEDRSRLARELDAASSRLRALEAAHGEAARRIERASAAVRAVLADDSSGEG